MGSGQSALSQDDILAQAKQYYKDNPEGFEDLYRKAKGKTTLLTTITIQQLQVKWVNPVNQHLSVVLYPRKKRVLLAIKSLKK